MGEKNDVEPRRVKIPARCDIFQSDERVVIKLEMPGVQKEDLDVRVDNDLLIVSGKKSTQAAEGKFLVREIRAADYYQEYTLDDTIDRNSIDAVIKNGVVTLNLSLKESVKPRKIEIKTA